MIITLNADGIFTYKEHCINDQEGLDENHTLQEVFEQKRTRAEWLKDRAEFLKRFGDACEALAKRAQVVE